MGNCIDLFCPVTQHGQRADLRQQTRTTYEATPRSRPGTRRSLNPEPVFQEPPGTPLPIYEGPSTTSTLQIPHPAPTLDHDQLLVKLTSIKNNVDAIKDQPMIGRNKDLYSLLEKNCDELENIITNDFTDLTVLKQNLREEMKIYQGILVKCIEAEEAAADQEKKKAMKRSRIVKKMDVIKNSNDFANSKVLQATLVRLEEELARLDGSRGLMKPSKSLDILVNLDDDPDLQDQAAAGPVGQINVNIGAGKKFQSLDNLSRAGTGTWDDGGGRGTDGTIASLNEIQDIKMNVEALRQNVLEFSGARNCKKYCYLDDTLLRSVQRLDKIDDTGDESLAFKKKQVLRYIYDLLHELEQRVTV